MPTGAAVDALDIPIDLDWTASEKSIQVWNQGWLKSMRGMEKASQRSMKGAGKAVAEFFHKTHGAHKMWSKEIDKADAAYKELGETIGTLQTELDGLNKRIEENQALGSAANKGAIADLQKQVKETERLRDAQTAARESIKEQKAELQEKITFDAEEITEAGVQAGKALVSPITALFRKDIPGAAEALTGGLMAGAKWTADYLGDHAEEWGKKFGEAGGELLAKASKEKKQGNYLKAAGMGAGGKALQGLSKLTEAIGPMVKSLSSIGPILGMVSASVMALVKAFIDAQAMVMEINKTILATSSTTTFLARNMGNVDAAAQDLQDTLKKVSDSALSLDNIGWGISKDTHAQVISSLTAEGVSLATLDKQYGQLNATSKAYSNTFGSITEMAVTYSRLMGVSLGEITQLQGEMMTEMGASLTDVQKTFHQMATAAEGSGIAANKFFSIIRGVSADLALYNTRMEDAVKLLGALGKVMSPRNAQQFMSTAMNAYKGVSFQEKVQQSLLAGPGKFADIVAADIKSKNDSLAKSIAAAGGGNVEDIKKALDSNTAEGRQQVKDFIAKADVTQQGTLTEAAGMLDVEKKRAAGGMPGNAAAISQVSAIGAAEAKFAAATHFGKPGGGIGAEAGGALAGASDEEIIRLNMLNTNVEDQRNILLKGETDEKKRAKIMKMTWQEILDTTPTAKDAAKAEADQKAQMDKEAKFAKAQGENVFNIMDKLQVLIDFFMGQFYGVIVDIADKLGAGDKDKRQLAQLQIAASKSGNKELADILASSVSMEDAQTKIAASKGKEQTATLTGAGGAIQGLQAESVKLDMALIKSKDKAEMDSIVARKKAVDDEIKKEQDKYAALADAIDKQFGGSANWADPTTRTARGDKLGTAAEAAGLSEETSGQLTDLVKQGKSLADAFQTVGVSTADQGKIMEELRKGLSPTQLVAATTQAGQDPAWKPLDAKDTTDAVREGQTAARPDGAAYDAAGLHGGSVYTHDIHTEALAEDAAEVQQSSDDTLDLIYKALRVRGIKVEKIGSDKAQDALHDAVLDAARQALVEYYLMQQMPAGDLQKALQGGASGADIMQQAFKDASTAPANAAGGLVTGITDGLALVRSAPGEGLASVGPGETITGPGGGGGGSVKVELSLKGDLGRIIDARADDRYSVNKGREKFR